MNIQNIREKFNTPIWKAIRPIVITVISLIIVIILSFSAINFVVNKYLLPIDKNDDEVITVEIPMRSSTSSIANILYGESDSPQVIKNKAIFKIYVDFMGKSSTLKSGTYELKRSMGVGDIVDKIASGASIGEQVVQFTLIEGMKIEDMAQALLDSSAIKSKERFLEICNTKEYAKNVDIAERAESDKRKYQLEGYLFPDTYKAYKDSDEEAIVSKLVTKFNEVITAEYHERAQELGYTMDEIITIASIIEKEAKNEDFAKVSAIFHNRLNIGMPLQSCTTLQYILNIKHYVLSKEEIATDTPYNTYTLKGLPPGPISNPGKAAIEAALYPDPAFIAEEYMYFCLREPGSGKLAYAKTLKEHDENVALYRDMWLESDAKLIEQGN